MQQNESRQVQMLDCNKDKIVSQWRRGVRIKSLAAMYGIRTIDVEIILQSRLSVAAKAA